MLANANNDPTDCWYLLGLPAKIQKYPLNEIQSLWQVTTALAVIEVSQLSSILRDNKKSCLIKEIVDMIHIGMFDSISILTVDNVALYGYDLLLVICTRCGQASEMSLCGLALSKPKLVYFLISTLLFALLVSSYAVDFRRSFCGAI